jgi:hypothetical protein
MKPQLWVCRLADTTWPQIKLPENTVKPNPWPIPNQPACALCGSWTCGNHAGTSLEAYCDPSITAEYYRRVRAKKAASVAAGGPRGGWPKGKPRSKALPTCLKCGLVAAILPTDGGFEARCPAEGPICCTTQGATAKEARENFAAIEHEE